MLRTALALSLVTGRPFRIERIRAGRTEAGAAAPAPHRGAGGGRGERRPRPGAELGSQRAALRAVAGAGRRVPPRGGTAGSATLVLQTVLPALLSAREPSRLTLEGGTHNPFAPPFDFLATDVPAVAAPDGSVGRGASGTYGLLSGRRRPLTVVDRAVRDARPLSLLERGATRVCRARGRVAAGGHRQAGAQRRPRAPGTSIGSSAESRPSMTSVGPGTCS